MSITSRDIQEQSFEMARHGYDVQEVDVFLEHMAAEVDVMARQNAEYTMVVEELRAKLRDAETVSASVNVDPFATQKIQMTEELIKTAEDRAQLAEEKLAAAENHIVEIEKKLEEKGNDAMAISEAFIAAQRSANALKEEARAEGERLYREAEAKCRELLADAQTEKKVIEQDIQTLRDSRDRFVADYTAMLQSFISEAQTVFENGNASDYEASSARESVAQISHTEDVSATPALDLDYTAEKTTVSAPVAAQRFESSSSYKSAYADVPLTVSHKGDAVSEYGETDAFEIEEID